jgi:hypothetical protein
MSRKKVVASKTHEWKCPKCDAPWSGHGRGGLKRCKSKGIKTEAFCDGLVCECEYLYNPAYLQSHGVTLENPCPNAECCHCGWRGTLPLEAAR